MGDFFPPHLPPPPLQYLQPLPPRPPRPPPLSLTIDTSSGFNDDDTHDNSQSMFMNDNEITVDDYLTKMAEKCGWTPEMQSKFRVIYDSIMNGLYKEVPSEEQDNDGWEFVVEKPPTYKGYLVFGYKDFKAPAMIVYRKGNKIRKIYTYDITKDIKQSILSVAKEIFMQQEAYRLLHPIKINRNTSRNNNALSLRTRSKRMSHKSQGNRNTHRTRTYPSVSKLNKWVTHKSVGSVRNTRSRLNLRRFNRNRTEMEQLKPFFVIPKLTHTTFNMRTILEMDYLEGVKCPEIANIMIEEPNFAITWRDRIYRLFAELKRNRFYHNDTSTQRQNIFFIKQPGVDNKKREDQYKVGIIDFGQSEISFNENFRGQPQLDGLPMAKENIEDFIKWIKGKCWAENIEYIYGGSRKK
jgi:hypothetical protein